MLHLYRHVLQDDTVNFPKAWGVLAKPLAITRAAKDSGDCAALEVTRPQV